MEAAVYRRMAEHEETHWWFRGRRAVINRLLQTLHLEPSRTRLLEVGCGTGGNLELLRQFGRVDALEFDADARIIAGRKANVPVGFCELPTRIDAPDQAYDVIALLDVLEHVDGDLNALRAVAFKLNDEGRVVLTVPAHPWLWSSHDDIHHHKRRYTRSSLKKVIAGAGLQVERIGFFNMFLLPFAVGQRFIKRAFVIRSSDDEMPGVIVNRLLTAIFHAESHLVDKVPFPTGLSLFAIARKPRTDVST